MQWTREGLQQPTNLLEAAALHYALKLICRCGHSATFNPHGLWWHFTRRGWNDQLSEVPARLWCRVCGSGDKRKVRPMRVELVMASAGDIQLPFPPERRWKEEMRRVR